MRTLLLVVLVALGLNTTQAQTSNSSLYFCCDSITYNIDPSQGFNISLDTTHLVHDADSIEVYWGICNSDMCYSGTGMFAYFGQVMTTDTLKVCYDAYIYEANSMEVCTRCDSVIFDQNTNTWILFSMGNTTNIEELVIDRFEIDANIYDLSGRQLKQIPLGVMYIKNNKLYIKTK